MLDREKEREGEKKIEPVTKYRCANKAIDDLDTGFDDLDTARTNNKGVIIVLLLSY